MKDRPILFSGAMVRALLAGTKTQTRRPLRDGTWWTPEHGVIRMAPAGLACTGIASVSCPYGAPGDRLWVRETWMDLQGTGVEVRTGDRSRYAYGADTPAGSYGDEQRKLYGLKWRPSIHRPRAASRITLDVVGVRVERLREISEEDAISEGIERTNSGFWSTHGRSPDGTYNPRTSFRTLWESINGPGSWDANPWVWVVEFKRANA